MLASLQSALATYADTPDSTSAADAVVTAAKNLTQSLSSGSATVESMREQADHDMAASVATINYLDLSANPQSIKQVPLPWTLTLTTTSPATSPILLAQGNTGTIGCRITVDGKVKDEKSAGGVDAFTFCQVKSA